MRASVAPRGLREPLLAHAAMPAAADTAGARPEPSAAADGGGGGGGGDGAGTYGSGRFFGSAEESAGLFSRLMFWWMWPTLALG